jgi:hypothetical protein
MNKCTLLVFALPFAALAQLAPLGGLFEGAKVTSRRSRQAEGMEFTETKAKLEAWDAEVSIEEIGPASETFAGRYKDLIYQSVTSAYGNRPTPYTGQTTAVLTCAPASKPQTQAIDFKGRSSELIVAGATARNAFGACLPGLAVKKGLLWIGYDPGSRRLYHVRIFIPSSKYDPKFLDELKRSLSRPAETKTLRRK